MDHVRKLKFSSYVHLPLANKIYQYLHAKVILSNVGEVMIFNHGRFISALEHTTVVILRSYALLACINTIYIYIW